MMNAGDDLDGSFRIYVDPKERPVIATKPEDPGHLRPEIVPQALEAFHKDVQNVKEDVIHLEKISIRLQECTEWFKTMNTAKSLMELRTQVNMEMANAIKLAKLISKKYDGLVTSNAAQRMVHGDGPGSASDKARVSMILEIRENVKAIIRVFQVYRARSEAYNKEVIEDRYYTIIGEKPTEEAVEMLVSGNDYQGILNHAIQIHGRAIVIDTVSEIEERRGSMKEVRKNLMSLHQVLLGITSPVEKQGVVVGKVGGGGLPSPVDALKPVVAVANNSNGVFGRKIMGKLNDYERETRNQAYMALVVALVCSVVLVAFWLWVEDADFNNPQTKIPQKQG